MKGKTGGEALNGAFKYGGDAGRYSAQVTNAFLGTQPRDLSRLVAGAGAHLRRLRPPRGRDLQGLIVNFDVFTGALAAQSANLTATVHRLAPTLRSAHTSLVSLNRTLPPLRAYAIELTPGGRRAARPDRRLQTVARTGPPAALRQGGRRRRQAAGRSDAGPRRRRPGGQGDRAAAAQPAQPLHDQGPGPDRQPDDRTTSSAPAGPTTASSSTTLANFAGQGQNFDGNGPYLRLQPGGGDLLVEQSNPNGNLTTDKQDFAHTIAPPLGTQPQLGGRPPKKPEVRCDTNPVPDLNAGSARSARPAPRR